MAALRVPFAVGSGVFLSLSLFWVLWIFVGAPLVIDDAVRPIPVVFTTPRPPVPPVTKRTAKVELEPPPAVPERIDIGPGDTTIDNVVPFERPTVGVPGRPALVVADRDAQPFVRIEPDYPPRAIAQQLEGWVKVQFTVTATGGVRDAFVVESSPANVFDAAALKAVARWRYQPKVESGTAVERVGVQTLFRFNLEE
jgi:protein TonB